MEVLPARMNEMNDRPQGDSSNCIFVPSKGTSWDGQRNDTDNKQLNLQTHQLPPLLTNNGKDVEATHFFVYSSKHRLLQSNTEPSEVCVLDVRGALKKKKEQRMLFMYLSPI